MTTATQPRTFTDANGKVWDVTLTLAGARRVDSVDYSDITSKEFSILSPNRELFTDILTDTNLLFAIVFAIVRPQIKANLGIDLDAEGLTQEEQLETYRQAEEVFVAGLNGKAIHEGREAVWGSVVDFFPEHETVLSTLKNQLVKAQKRINAEVVKMEPEIEDLMNKEIDAGVKEMKKTLTSQSA